jgi:formate C-acetyltransferase
MVMEYGIAGLIGKARASLEGKTDEGRRIFLTSIIEVYEAITRYILRYADAADEKGMADVASTLRKAALEKPSDFRTALQLSWIITLIDCSYVSPNPTLTVGRMDKLLYPFYRADIESGKLTREEAAELITDYYCKHNLNMGRGEHQVGDASNSSTFARVFNFDAPQYLLLGGTDIDGNYTINDLTYLFAECIRPEFKNPVVVFYYAPGMDKVYPDLWHTLTSKALRSSALMLQISATTSGV